MNFKDYDTAHDLESALNWRYGNCRTCTGHEDLRDAFADNLTGEDLAAIAKLLFGIQSGKQEDRDLAKIDAAVLLAEILKPAAEVLVKKYREAHEADKLDAAESREDAAYDAWRDGL